jgi:hypothetical protein
MSEREVVIKVRLDTGPAEVSLEDLNRKAETKGRNMLQRIRGAVGMGVRAVGIGAGIGIATSALRTPTSSGFGDVIGEAFGGIGKQIEMWALGDMGQTARADRYAREMTKDAFAQHVGMAQDKGPVMDRAKAYFNAVQALRLNAEKGIDAIEKDDAFRSTDPVKLMDQIASKIKELLTDAVDLLWRKLTGAA